MLWFEPFSLAHLLCHPPRPWLPCPVQVSIDYNAGFTGALAALNQAPVSYGYCKSKGLQRQKKG